MNKKALLDYALFARKELETQIALSLNKLGIYKDKILKANIVGDYTIIESNPDSYPKRVYNLRKTMISEYFEGEEKFETVVEEFAYTWFNRLVAIRFMEVHDYFPHGFHVLTSRDGSYEPEILSNLPYVVNELKLEEDVVRSLRDQNKIEELYRYVLVKQCAALSKIIPDIFDVREPYLELLLPNNLLSQDSVVRKIEMIPEEDFMNDIEVVGWLYQFYVQSNREEFRKSKLITKDLIPTLSQVFTPDWIVRYMADNSVGRLWLESYPDSSLRSELKYYVDDAKQDEETQKKLDEIKYKNVNPEEIKIIEPCCGSGHILVYVFDLLLKMYLEQGYNKRDIPSYILRKNLFGLDIDKRASQLAKFSLIMKARSIDNRFFNEDRFVNPRVFEIKDSQLLSSENYKEAMKSLHFSAESIELAEYLVNTFEHAKVLGSLLKVVPKDYSVLVDDIKRCKDEETPGLFEEDFYHRGVKRLNYLIRIARVFSRKYDVMITNPPYLESGKMADLYKKYFAKFYPNSKTDMFSMFMDTGFVTSGGYQALVNPDNWMFLVSFNKLREQILSKQTLISMIHLGMGVFDAVVQATTFVIRNSFVPNFRTKFYRYVENKNPEEKMLLFNKRENEYTKQANLLRDIPNCLFAYWVSDSILSVYEKSKPLNEYCWPCQGLAVSGNDKFMRLWFEVNLNDLCLLRDCSVDYWKETNNYKWFFHSKGGEVRKWYGNEDYVINFADNGKAVSANFGSVIRNSRYYFKEAISWSDISSASISFRYKYPGHCFDAAGPSIFFDNKTNFNYIFGILNSKVISVISKFVSPALHFSVGQVAEYPLIDTNEENKNVISELVIQNVEIAKREWDSREYSYDFSRHFLLAGKRLTDAYSNYYDFANSELIRLKENEEKINSIALLIYDLQNELETTVSFDDINYKIQTKSDSAKSLISYFVGVLMGRYSLTQEGLVYAGGPFDRSKFADYVDEDGILPIYQFVGINDGLTKSICDMVKQVYGDTYYRENLDFIADALGRKSDEGAEEAINRYLNDEFYKDHLKVYQNRPIYWMFNSGKVGAFKCLIYLHRYDKNTLAKINAKYFLPRTAMYKAERERLTDQLTRADIVQRKKLETQLRKIEEAEDELQLYGQVLDHMANQYIDIDLDDGVKVNYVKFQGISLEVNGATIKKDLLVPFGLEKKK